MDLTQRFAAFGLVPVIVIDDAAHAVPLARALAMGGLPVAEITCRTPAAMQAIRNVAAEAPDVLVGAGTVLTVAQAAMALDAGAAFIVAPGFNPEVVGWCRNQGVPVVPGVDSPSAIEGALAFGLELLKFFPAEALGGIGFLKAMAGPYAGVRFMPTGGIHADNLAGYLAWDRVAACGGTWLADRSLVAAGRFDEIAARTRRAMAAVLGLRLERVELFGPASPESESLCALLAALLGADAASATVSLAAPAPYEQEAHRLGRLICTTRDPARAAAFFARLGVADLGSAGLGGTAGGEAETGLAGFTLRLAPRRS
ncbi:MAG: bifunctional 4-hydroxy-2-oxoglutarate aldolase/2-dehydro-3-deoxy-phosphogluconate aldolase [Desulfovibrionaceae bacterium]